MCQRRCFIIHSHRALYLAYLCTRHHHTQRILHFKQHYVLASKDMHKTFPFLQILIFMDPLANKNVFPMAQEARRVSQRSS